MISRIKNKIYKLFLKTPFLNRYSIIWYKKLGVKGNGFRVSTNITVVGDYKLLELSNQTEINAEVFILAKNKIVIGENSTLAYQATILTSANPNGPHNKLSKIYPKVTKPVTIGHDCWVGARAIILPGVTIGNYCVVAAGAVVNKDIPDFTVVAGVPARKIKGLDPTVFE